MTKVFISYSRKDIDFARRLAGDLENAGYDVWWDLTDLRGGDDWPRVIPAAIESSDRFIVVLSPNSAESDWVEKEYTQALSLRKKIIPIMLKRSNIPFALNTINYIDFTGDDYAASLNHLLQVLGYTGEPVVPAPLPFSLLGALRKYAIPIGIGLLILLALLARFALPPAPSPTPTPSSIPTSPTTPAVIITSTDTPTVLPTNSPSATPTATETKPTNTETSTPTSTPTLTPTVILPQALALPICVYSDSSTVNVREGPGTGFYKVLGSLESDGSQCPFFSARIANAEGIWFQLAPDQQFAGRWISGRGLAAADTDLPPLPICIYHPDSPDDAVEIRVLPFQDGTLLENPLKANGASCPFFDTRIENNEGTWYRLSPNQRGKVEFQPYAGGWVHEDFLVIHTLSLPTVTLTPTPLSSDTPTVIPSLTPTDTPIPTPTDTETPLATETPTP